MRLQALTLGYALDVWKPRTGRVHSTFDHSVNVLIDGELWTLLDASRPDAPFGIRFAQGDGPGGRAVATGDPVHVRAGSIGVGRMVVDCRAASRWKPTPWAHAAAGIEARLSTLQRMMRARAWPESAAMANDLMEALCESGLDSDARLANAVRRTIGRGPGLTPSGDDVLVGILTVLTSGAAGPAGAWAASRLVRAMAPLLASTPDISRHLLDQAARGLAGRALHDLGRTLMEEAAGDVLARAVTLVLDTGCTSGADAGIGLAAACRHSFLERRAPA